MRRARLPSANTATLTITPPRPQPAGSLWSLPRENLQAEGQPVREANFLQRQKSNQNSCTPLRVFRASVVILLLGHLVRIRQRRYVTKLRVGRDARARPTLVTKAKKPTQA
jgi:hypothetical protein